MAQLYKSCQGLMKNKHRSLFKILKQFQGFRGSGWVRVYQRFFSGIGYTLFMVFGFSFSGYGFS